MEWSDATQLGKQGLSIRPALRSAFTGRGWMRCSGAAAALAGSFLLEVRPGSWLLSVPDALAVERRSPGLTSSPPGL